MRPNSLTPFRKQIESWLTVRRLRAHGLLLALTIWSLYVWTLATPGLQDRNGHLKGTDFLHFYTVGSLARAHRGNELYDIQAQIALAAQRVPEASGIRYLPLYPPQVSLLFEPFANLPYATALALWWMITALIYGVCCYAIWRACPNLRGHGATVALLSVAYPAFFHLIAWGQTSALAVACFTGGFLLLRRQREFTAGMVLGCLIFKPQLGMAAVVVFLAIGAWRVLAGSVLSAGLQIGLGVLYFGTEPYRLWLRTLLRVPAMLGAFEPRTYQTHCLRTFWSMLVPWNSLSFALYALSAAFVLGWTILLWKRRQSLSLRYSALLLATVLVSLHLTVYDLVILAPALLLIADWLIPQVSPSPGLGTLLYLVYVLPLVGPFTRWIHVQLSVAAMVGLIYLLCQQRKTAQPSDMSEFVANTVQR